MKVLLLFIYLIITVTMAGCGGVSEPTDAETLAKCYKTEFGDLPPVGVSNLKAKQVVIGDAGGAWLRFEADSNIVAQIVSNRFIPSDRATFIENSGGANAPLWWEPEKDSLAIFYINNQWSRGSNYSVAVFGCDDAHHTVYFHHGVSF
jgi:hypothetical protein